MNKLFVIALISLLTGCSLIFPPPWDNNEHLLFAQLKTKVESDALRCDDSKYIADQLNSDIQPRINLILNYTNPLPRSGGGYDMITEINTMVGEMVNRYKGQAPSTFYCQAKFKIIDLSLDRSLKALAERQ